MSAITSRAERQQLRPRSPAPAPRRDHAREQVAGASVFREAEDALAEDVAEDFRGACADAAAAREETVELPLAFVGRPLARRRDLRVRPDHLGGDLREILIHLTPEELGRRSLRPRRLAAQDAGEAAVAVELQTSLG